MVTIDSLRQFKNDEVALTQLEGALFSREYSISEIMKKRLAGMFGDVCDDRFIYNNFKQISRSLFEVSETLEELSVATGLVASMAERKAREVVNWVGVEFHPPNQSRVLSL